jgi:hypothetical protein
VCTGRTDKHSQRAKHVCSHPASTLAALSQGRILYQPWKALTFGAVERVIKDCHVIYYWRSFCTYY